MSGQEASGNAGTSSTGAIPKVPKSSNKKHKQKHIKPAKNKTAKKNAKILRVTTAKTPEQDADFEQVDDKSEIQDPVEDPNPADDLPDIEDLTLKENIQVAEDHTLVETNKIAEQEEPIPDETNPMDINTTTADENNPADNANVNKVKNRKRRNRKVKKSANEVVPGAVLPSEPEIAKTNVPISAPPSYSAVVLPFDARKSDKPPVEATRGTLTYFTSDEDSGDPNDDCDYDYYDQDYGGVQDSYYEF